MMIALTHFGSDEFLPLLKLWFDRYLKSGCHLNVVVLSDKKVKVPAAFEPYDPTRTNQRFAVARFDPIAEVVRPGRAFDMKGSLVLSGIEMFADHKVFLVDSDAFFLRDP